MVTNASHRLCCQAGGVAQFPGHGALGIKAPRPPPGKPPVCTGTEHAAVSGEQLLLMTTLPPSARHALSSPRGPASPGLKKAQLGRGGARGDCWGARPLPLSSAPGYVEVCGTGLGSVLDFKRGTPR